MKLVLTGFGGSSCHRYDILEKIEMQTLEQQAEEGLS